MLTPPFSGIDHIRKENFSSEALCLYLFQRSHNGVYHRFCGQLNLPPPTAISQIPFLPISFFKTHRLVTGAGQPQISFTSSGTTGTATSTHHLVHASVYEQSFRTAFEKFYGPVTDWCILGLLPAYLERSGSSLVYMVDRLIQESGHPESGFFLHDQDRLAHTLTQLESRGQKSLLIGVTYALLDFAHHFPMRLKYTTVMETGGMKGRRKELLREEVHKQLKAAFGLTHIHSEYGMTELLSQAYAKANGRFSCPPWMQVLVRSEDDPLLCLKPPAHGTLTGALNIIDLANIWSAAFIATDDLGKLYPDGSFEVLGRLDNSDVRGCSLLAV